MIKTFADKEATALFANSRVRRFGREALASGVSGSMPNGASVSNGATGMHGTSRSSITTNGGDEMIHINDLPNTDFSDVSDGLLSPVHPGEILLEDFLKPMGITQYRLAKEIGVPQRRIGEIVAGKRAVTTDTGLRLSRFFGMSDGFWIGLQADYDMARTRTDLADILANIRPVAHA
ncbi:MAG TPA: HigA family addiction module antitoxin [Mariprofundaceae bacterium]|nr:HigA family addiction module antitoxin [Mariprofundaceae bacterium]